jgi:hypothetical protein
MNKYALSAAPLALIVSATAANAAAPAPKFGDPVAFGEGFTFDPMLDARLRWEDVDATSKSADAVTLRVRAGAEVKHKASGLSVLFEGEGNVALAKSYSAFPYANTLSDQYRPTKATIADPQNGAINRLQIAYQNKYVGLTVGRQRINLDDQRFVGSVGWRQNEQTFDAVRGTAAYGPLSLDATYATKQRSIYGNDGGARIAYGGEFVFLGAGVKNKYGAIKGFGYLLDYDKTAFSNAATRGQLDSSQTWGLRVTPMTVKLSKSLSASGWASYANQTNYGNNAKHYDVDYLAYEGSLAAKDHAITGGYERLGSDRSATGGAWSMQTPMATLHKFNGWADLFLTTPANGLADTYVGLSGKFPKVTAIPGLTYGASYHWYGSNIHAQKYGNEFDAQVGFKTRKVTWTVKYADYAAKGFGADTKKFWLQAEYGF